MADHIVAMVHKLADEKLPVEEIAFMTRMNPETVREELRKRQGGEPLNTTKKDSREF